MCVWWEVSISGTFVIDNEVQLGFLFEARTTAQSFCPYAQFRPTKQYCHLNIGLAKLQSLELLHFGMYRIRAGTKIRYLR